MQDPTKDPADLGEDDSEHSYANANPPTWSKSERADKNLPNPSGEEWEDSVTCEHPAKHDHDGSHH